MPKTKHENGVGIVSQLVDDPIRSMNDLANQWIAYLWNNLAHLRKRSDEERLVDESVAELTSAFGAVTCDIRDNVAKALLRSGGENYWPAHVSTSFRASSAARPSRLCACSRAVLIPASSSISQDQRSIFGQREKQIDHDLSIAHAVNLSEPIANDKFADAALCPWHGDGRGAHHSPTGGASTGVAAAATLARPRPRYVRLKKMKTPITLAQRALQ